MTRFKKSLVGAVIGFGLFAGVSATVQWAYYRFTPASWFISIQGVPEIANASVGSDLLLTFCRSTRDTGYDTVSTRSFYSVATDGTYTAAGQYQFKATIEHDKVCQTIHIPPDKHPNKAGTYTAHTDMAFVVHGHEKVLSYDTNQFVISDTKQSIEQQIQELQRQIDELRHQLSLRTGAQSHVAAAQTVVVGASDAPPESGAITAPAASMQVTPLVVSPPPQPPTPAAPSPTLPLRPVIDYLQETVSGLGL